MCQIGTLSLARTTDYPGQVRTSRFRRAGNTKPRHEAGVLQQNNSLSGKCDRLTRGQNLVDQTVLESFRSREDLVAVDVLIDLLD
jgi:hypothetical protein